MKVLVTGGGGYLGTVLVRQLLEDPLIEIVVLDRFSWGVQPLASLASPTRPHFRGRLTVIEGDVRRLTVVEDACNGVEAIVHLAGIVGYPACDADPADADSTNVEGTRHVVWAAAGRPVIFASTGSTYGKVEGIATEATPISPLTRYGRNKAAAEAIVAENPQSTIFRFATLYGLSPRMRWDLLPHHFLRTAAQTGRLQVFDPEARRTFLHVEDAARAIIFALRKRLSGLYNVGGYNVTKGYVAEQGAQLTGCRVAVTAGHDPDERDYAVSYDRIEATGWRRTEPFDLAPLLPYARIWK